MTTRYDTLAKEAAHTIVTVANLAYTAHVDIHRAPNSTKIDIRQVGGESVCASSRGLTEQTKKK